MNEARGAAVRWLNEQGIIDPSSMSEVDFNSLRDLIGSSRGLGVLMAILQFRRQMSVQILLNAQLGTAPSDCAASVLQGQIAALDGVRDLLLDIADPTPAAAGEAEQEQVNNG